MQPARQEAVVVLNRRGALAMTARAAIAGLPAILRGAGRPRRRSARLRYQVELPDAEASALLLWLPVPQSDENQVIEDLRFAVGAPHQIHTGSYGNRYLFAAVRPRQTVTMEFHVTRAERSTVLAGSRPMAAPDCCLAPDRLVPVDGKIRQWAQEVIRNAQARSDLEKARAIYEYIVDTVKYDKSGKGWGRGDIYYACDARRGNCTDFHAIFIGYARAVGIPAKFAIGVPLPPGRDSGEIAGYHCWAEFFAPGVGWVPVDASEAAKDPSRRKYFFGTLDEHRVEFSKGRDLVLSPAHAAGPINFFVYPHVEHGGRPVSNEITRITCHPA